MTHQRSTIIRTDVWRSVRSLTHMEIITMRMTSAISRGLVLPLVLLGLLAAAPLARAAVITNHSGTICKNLNAADVSYIDSLVSNATRSLKNATTWLVCPLTRNTINSHGAMIYVDITHGGANAQTTSCSVTSRSYFGQFLAIASQSWTGTGAHEFALDLTGAGKSDVGSNYSVVCSIPGNGNGLVHAVDLYEN